MADHPSLSPCATPRQLSSFVGRAVEIEELRQLARITPLLTLTGTGGCGKTRLAIALAAALGPHFPDGVAYIDLAPVREPAAVVDSVGAGLGLIDADVGRLGAAIGAARLLILLDNADHLVEAVSCLAVGLLIHCPNLHIVVTSRQLLDVRGEVSWRVPPLSLPPTPAPGALIGMQRAASSDAMLLLVTRLSEHSPGFRLTEDNVELASAICHRLGGIPLALELAAARIRTIGLAEVAARLDDCFRLLTHGSRTAIVRHRTLRATLEWSYALLDEAERRLLRRLAVFVGEVDLEAIECVCASTDLPAAEIPEVLHRLVDKSLVVSHPTPAGGMRYGLMEVIRQYCRGRLGEAGEAGHLADHARHYALLLERVDRDDDDVRRRVELLRSEYDNVRVAFDWTADHDHALEARMVARARWYWRQCGLVREPLSRTISVLEKGPHDIEQRLDLSLDAADWYMQAGDAAAGLALIAEVTPLLDKIDDPERQALLLSRRGSLRLAIGDCDGARLDLVQALDIQGTMPPGHETVATLNTLARVQLQSGRPDDALAQADRALAMLASLATRRPPAWQPNLMQTRGATLLAVGRTRDARTSFIVGLELAAEYGNQRAAIALLHGLACVAAELGQAPTCLELLAAAERCARAIRVSSLPMTGTPSDDAERRSRQALGESGAAEAWNRGMRLDLAEALDRVRADGRVDQRLPLPPRKAELVRLVAAGLANKEIARRMSISERTVEAHLDQVRQLLGLHNRTQIATWAISMGLASLDWGYRPASPGSTSN